MPGVSDLRPLGSGGFATVFRGIDDRFGREVAIKVLHTEHLGAKARRRFEQECLAIGSLSGRADVVTVYDAGVLPDGRPYLKLELCTGSLADAVARSGPLDVAAVVDVGRRIGAALTAAHAAGLIHRDVTPANILVRRTGEPALADFGLSVRVEPDATAGLDALNPVHAAPECLERNDAHSPAGDVYSLGSTLHTLLSGSAPFARRPGEGVAAPLHRIRHEPVPPITRPDIPPWLADLVTAMLAKDPGQRPTAAQVTTALGGSVPAAAPAAPALATAGSEDVTGIRSPGSEPLLEAETGTRIRAREPVPAAARSRKGLVIGGIAGCVALAAVVGVLLAGPGEPEAAPIAPATTSPVPAPKIVLAPPVDRGTSVDLRWSGGTNVDYAVIVAGADQPVRTVFARRATTLRVPVDAGRGYCFAVQATDGKAVYQSEARSVRGAACTFDAPRS